jgi:outer membrane protein assembly factor BamB
MLGRLDSGWFYDPDYQWGFASSPILFRDMVIVQCDIQQDSFIAAFDVRTGEPVWRTERDEIPSWGTPTVYENDEHAVLITNATRFARGYNPYTGEELWRISGNSEITVPTPFVAHDLIFVASGYRPVQPIWAIRPGSRGDLSLTDGETSSDAIAWSDSKAGPYMPTPIVYGDYLYTCDNGGVLCCYEATTGKRLYRRRFARGGGASFVAAPVAADGRLYLTGEEGTVYVVQAGPKYALLSANPVGENCLATPAISDGMFLMRTQRHVIALMDAPPPVPQAAP